MRDQLIHRWRLLVWALVAIPLARVEPGRVRLHRHRRRAHLVWVGIPMLGKDIAVTRWLADLHRRYAGGLRGVTVERPYLRTTADSLLTRTRAVLADPATRRDVRWLFVNGTLGLVLAIVGVVEGILGTAVLVDPARRGAESAREGRRRPAPSGREEPAGAARPAAHRVARRDGRHAGSGVAAHRARSARRRAGAAGRDRHESRPGRGAAGSRSGSRQVAAASRRATPRATRSPSCAIWCAASIRRCSPTAGFEQAVRALASAAADPRRRAQPMSRGGRPRRSSRRPTSSSPRCCQRGQAQRRRRTSRSS